MPPQKIRSTAYRSFSVFWLLFIFICGLLVIALSATLQIISVPLQRLPYPRSSSYMQIEWRENHAFHLQRMAQEEHGIGQWKRGVWDIPVTSSEVKLPVLETSTQTGLSRLVKGSKNSTSADLVEKMPS
jgi:hypothetical protein